MELKVSFPASDIDKHAALCERLTDLLQPWLFECDKEDTPTLLADALGSYSSIAVIDMGTHGHLADLLTDHLRDLASSREILFQTQWRASQKSPKDAVGDALDRAPKFAVVLAVAGVDQAGNWAVGWRVQGTTFVTELAAPFKHSVHRSRTLKAIAALAIKAWQDALAPVKVP